MYGSKASMTLTIDNVTLKMNDLKVISMDQIETKPGKFVKDIVLDWQGKQSISIKIRDLYKINPE